MVDFLLDLSRHAVSGNAIFLLDENLLAKKTFFHILKIEVGDIGHVNRGGLMFGLERRLLWSFWLIVRWDFGLVVFDADGFCFLEGSFSGKYFSGLRRLLVY